VKYETGESLNSRFYLAHGDQDTAEFDVEKSLCHFEAGKLIHYNKFTNVDSWTLPNSQLILGIFILFNITASFIVQIPMYLTAFLLHTYMFRKSTTAYLPTYLYCGPVHLYTQTNLGFSKLRQLSKFCRKWSFFWMFFVFWKTDDSKLSASERLLQWFNEMDGKFFENHFKILNKLRPPMEPVIALPFIRIHRVESMSRRGVIYS
jgi:hypothetical protein